MKKWLGRLLRKGSFLRTIQSRRVGAAAEAWKVHGCYFYLTADTPFNRSPVSSMIERMVDAGLLEWEEESVRIEGRNEVRYLRSVVSEKGKAIALK